MASIINSILVTESSKVTDDAPFLKQSPTYLTIEAINSYGRDEAVVNFSLNANSGFSGSYDAYKISSVETYRPSVSTIIDDSVELSINQLPEQGVERSTEPLQCNFAVCCPETRLQLDQSDTCSTKVVSF